MKRALTTILVILFLISTFACGVPKGEPVSLYKVSDENVIIRQCSLPILYAINKDVPNKIQRMIIESFDYWDDLTDKDLFFYMGTTDWVPGDKASGIIVVVGLTHEVRTEEHKNTLAYVEPSTYWKDTGCLAKGSISIFADTQSKSDDMLRSVIRHEIGHILGFGHSPDSDDLMYRAIEECLIPELKGLSKWELEAFRLYYGDGK